MPCICPDRIPALDDTVFDVCIVSEIYFIQNDRVFDHTVISDKYLFKDDGVFYRTVNDTSASDKAVLHDRTRIVFCRRLVAHLGIYTRKLSEKVIPHLRLQEIHVCPVICIHSRYVAPIAAYLVPV